MITLVAETSFEDGDWIPGVQEHHDYGVRILDSGQSMDGIAAAPTAFHGGKLARFLRKVGDDGYNIGAPFRSEFHYSNRLDEKRRRAYRFMTYHGGPGSDIYWKIGTSEAWRVWWQLHPNNGSPMLALESGPGDRFKIKRRVGTSSTPTDVLDVTDLMLFDAWNEWIVDCLHSMTSDGFIHIWLNGTQIVDLNNVRTVPRDVIQVYPKQGNYHSYSSSVAGLAFGDSFGMADSDNLTDDLFAFLHIVPSGPPPSPAVGAPSVVETGLSTTGGSTVSIDPSEDLTGKRVVFGWRASSNPTSVTSPAGWTVYPGPNNRFGAIISPILDGSGPWTVYSGAGGNIRHGWVAVDGGGDPVVGTIGTTSGVIPGIEVPEDDSLVIAFASTQSSASSWTAPSTFTDVGIVQSGFSNPFAAAYKEDVDAQTLSDLSYSFSSDSSPRYGVLVVVSGPSAQPIVLDPFPFELEWTPGQGSVSVSNHIALNPSPFNIVWTGGAGSVAVSNNIRLTPSPFEIVWTGAPGSVSVSDNLVVSGGPFSLQWQGAQGSVLVEPRAKPGTVEIKFSAPTVTIEHGLKSGGLVTMPSYQIGTKVTVRATFKNAQGVPTDPSEVCLKALTPAGSESEYEYTRMSQGVYEIGIVPAVHGEWWARAEGDGDVEVSGEKNFTVVPSRFSSAA